MKNPAAALLVRTVVLLLTLQLVSGCGALLLGGAAAGTVGYVSGDLKAAVSGNFHDVVRATDRALDEDAITVTSKTVSAHHIDYRLKTPQGDTISLTITHAARTLTNVTIRVGVFGDEILSRRILEEIEHRLQ